jgi:hypothetical protein
MPATLTPEDHKALTTAMINAIGAQKKSEAEDSAILAAVAARAKNIRTIVGAALAVIGFIVTGTLAIHELQAKPTTEQVDTAIEVKIAPVRAEAARVNAVATDVENIREDVETIERVQDYQIEQSAWQGDVLQHVAERKRTAPPPKPASLKEKERELLRR